MLPLNRADGGRLSHFHLERMSPMKTSATLYLALAAALVVAADKDKPSIDAGKLVGAWNYVKGTKAGEEVPKGNMKSPVTFEKDKLYVPADKDEKFTMAYKIDATKTPATIDMEIKDGPIKEGKAHGIIALDGDELKLCYVMADEKRPTKFESTKDNKAFLFVLKKAK
jgi:uncharacterized protein (TIGR03067 family)